MRPRQWTKNLFVFAGVVFSKNAFNPEMLWTSIAAFVIFCLLSSGVYLINDIVDIEKDRQHPKKKNRPLAAGKISVKGAISAAILLSAAALAGAFAISPALGGLSALYFSLMVLYSFYLKQVIILDVFTIASGFVIRVVAGTEAIQVYLSPWVVMCTAFLALFIALGKRRNEMKLLGNGAQNHRNTLESYTLPLIDQMISIVTASTMVTYFLYTFKSGQSLASMATVPFVLFGLFRYLYLVYSENSGGSPEEIILTDRPLQVDLVLWIIISMALIY
ncbi:membrane protein [Desulfocucumis palustris]|uniref:Membrane protein n=2 Tax=Desulfocucumis palustris TaxID=1898651 RepID=A0A2L2XGA1_9FIRM|nr:membrane protein [Desulfocucumis palustris]